MEGRARFLAAQEKSVRAAQRVWLGLHLSSLLAFLAQTSANPMFLGRYSAVRLGIVGALALTLPAAWVAPRYGQRCLGRVRGVWHTVVVLGAVVLVGGLWAFPFGSTAGHVLLRAYISVVLGTCAFWSLQRGPVLPPRLGRALPWLLGLGVCVLLAWVATFFPPLRWVDEGYTTNLSWSFFHSGFPRLTIYQPMDVRAMGLVSWGLGAWLSAFGFSLAAARLYIFAVGLLGFGVVFWVGRKQYGAPAAWAGVVAGVFGLSAINTVFRDIEVALLVALALYAAWRATHGGAAWWHGVAGFLVAFSVDGHPIAYRLALGFGAAYVWEWALLWRARGRLVWHRPLGWFVLGGVLGVGCYVFLYTRVWSVLGQYSAISPMVFNGVGSFRVLGDELAEALRSTPILFVLSALGAFVAWRRNTPFDRLLVFALVVPFVVLALWYPRMRQYYLMHTLTLQALLVASLFQGLVGALADRRREMTAIGGLLVLLTVANGALLWEGVQRRSAQGYDEALALAAEVRALLSPGAVVVAPDPFYFGLWELEFREAATPAQMALREGISTMEAWERLFPQAVLVVHSYPIPQLSQSAAEFVRAHGYTLAHTWESPQLGLVELYVRAE